MSFWYILIPLLSAFIGWFTNWIAIKMLFHPREPRKILFFTFQGVFPKRQAAFAQKLGKLVSEELLSFSDIKDKISNPDNLEKVMPVIDNHIDHFLRVRLSDQMPVISMFIGDKTINSLKTLFMTELRELFPVIMQKYADNLQGEIDLEKIVAEKVAGFSSDKLESILNQIMKKELGFVELLGGVIGFLIGVIQVLITLLTAG
ncbi:MAG: DUF445 family protein [Chitinophagaceae bacterium]|nr:DUF445 family protein [Chitinophagaceae bacterium]